MEKALYAVDELSGFILACAYVRPERLDGMTAKSVKKKLKQPSFAAAVNREELRTRRRGARRRLRRARHVRDRGARGTQRRADARLRPAPRTGMDRDWSAPITGSRGSRRGGSPRGPWCRTRAAGEQADRVLERLVVKWDELPAPLAQQMVVVLPGRIDDLVARDPVAELEGLDEVCSCSSSRTRRRWRAPPGARRRRHAAAHPRSRGR